MALERIAIDTSKHVFILRGVDERGHVVLRRDLKRRQVGAFFKEQPATEGGWRRAAGRATGAALWPPWATGCG